MAVAKANAIVGPVLASQKLSRKVAGGAKTEESGVKIPAVPGKRADEAEVLMFSIQQGRVIQA